MNTEGALLLLEKFANGNLSSEDNIQLQDWVSAADSETMETILQRYEATVMQATASETNQLLLQKIKERIAAVEKVDSVPENAVVRRMFNWKRTAVAASIVLVVGLGTAALVGVFTNKQTEPIAQSQQQRFKNDIAPAQDKAILTLSDGSSIILDDANNGNLATQGNSNIIKKDGQLVYNESSKAPSPKERAGGEAYNTITTAKGKQYELILADGTKVWLNAATSLRFPATFSGKDRVVELTDGEAYFEVAHNSSRPFKVNVAGRGDIEVLGTHFNVNAYKENASIQTTLLEGAVKFTSGNRLQILKPGQAAVVGVNTNNSNPIELIPDADIEHIMAWKDRLFDFDNEELTGVMEELSRWYDIDVVYQGPVPEGHYSGAISREVNISGVLKMFEALGGVEFSIDGNKVFVKAK